MARLYFTPARPKPLPVSAPLWERLDHDPRWIAEAKLDGVRCLICVGQVPLSRHGRPLKLAEGVLSTLACLPPQTLLDGELVRETLHLFDVLRVGSKWVGGEPLLKRRALLFNLGLPLVTGATTGKREFLRRVIGEGVGEGVVLKCLSDPYPGTATWFKTKEKPK